MSVSRVPDSTDELSLSDIIRVMVRRRKVVAAVFLTGLFGSILLTLTIQPQYEGRASFLILNEKDAVVALIESEAYAASVADVVGLTDEVGGDRATAASIILKRIVIHNAGRGDPANRVTIEATWNTADGAARLANAYGATLQSWRGFLVNVTHDTQWEAYYEQAGKDSTKAESQLDNLTREMRYVQLLDTATPPASPIHPNWPLNLSLGVAIGAMGALVAPFLVEGLKDARAELRTKQGSSSEEQRETDVRGPRQV